MLSPKISSNSKKRVTFAIAAYNHEKYVLASLESVWNDGYPHKEILIIDDGSSDDTPNIIRKWCEQKNWIGISYQTQSNAGITATLNKLISSSTGDYIRLVSSDDLLVPGGTQEMVSVLDADREAMAVFGDAVLINSAGAKVGHSTLIANGANKKKLSRPDLLTHEVIKNWAVSGPVILIRRDFYIQFGSYDESLLVDDWDLYLRILAIGGLRFINIPVAEYRVHGLNTSRTADKSKRINNLLSQARVAEKNIALFDSRRTRFLLISERHLLLAKISYLSSHLSRCTKHLFLRVAYLVKARLSSPR
jgi:glycosyltransferase involved in cell wall biosynthesis